MPSSRFRLLCHGLLSASASNALAAPHGGALRTSMCPRDVRHRGGARALGASPRRGGGADGDGDASSKRTILSPAALAGWYMTQLEAHELKTKFVSSGALSLVGDAFAQTIGHRMRAKGGDLLGVAATLDGRRLAAMFVDGLLFTGPLLHYMYELYEWILPTHVDVGQTEDGPAARKKFLATLAHVLFDNFVAVFLYVAVLMITTAIMEGRQSVIPYELGHDLWPAVKVSWRVSVAGYVPLQLLSFHYLPRKLRVLAVNVLDVIWVTVMSYMTHRNRH